MEIDDGGTEMEGGRLDDKDGDSNDDELAVQLYSVFYIASE